MNEPRCRRLIDRAIADFDLDLHGLTVATEAATGAYGLLCLMAERAGADRVLAIARDSRFGSADQVRRDTADRADRWGARNIIELDVSRDDPRLGEADIVTNSGHLRPIDAAMVATLSPTAVIPLMWETWEYRPADLDLDACRRGGIPVAGTNESHPLLGTIAFVGTVAVKLLLERDVAIRRCRVVVIGGGAFGASVEAALAAAGAAVETIVPAERSLADAEARHALAGADAAVFAEHEVFRPLVGPGGDLAGADLAELNDAIILAHITGNVDAADLKAAGLAVHPDPVAPPAHMSVSTAYAGPRPAIDLQAAGLKVGWALKQAVQAGLTGRHAELQAATRCDLVKPFADDEP